MERIPSPTGEAIKSKLSLSDVADSLGISRPTLYRYIEDYDRHDYSHMSGDVLRLFDIITDDDFDAVDAQAVLLEIRRNRRDRINSESEAARSDVERARRNVLAHGAKVESSKEISRGPRWILGDVKVTCIGQDGKAMVIFDGPRGSYRLRLWMDIDREPYMISEYASEYGKKFFLVDDVLPRPGYRFDVVCLSKDGEVSSGLQELRFR